MTASRTLPMPSASLAPAAKNRRSLAELQRSLAAACGARFTIRDAGTGDIALGAEGASAPEHPLAAELVRALSGRVEPTFLAEEEPLALLALPIAQDREARLVATATVLTRPVGSGEDLSRALAVWGWTAEQGAAWLAAQEAWSPNQLLRTARLWLEHQELLATQRKTQQELDDVSLNLVRTYEEICLLHSVAQNLRISSDDESLAGQVIGWLRDCLPVEGVAIQLLPVARAEDVTYEARTEPMFREIGQTQLDNRRLELLIEAVQASASSGPRVVNAAVTKLPDWPLPEIQQAIVVPLVEGSRLLGWLAAINHSLGHELGTVEASLLNSIATVLGIHASNRDLYRQQSEFLASVVRAMTSAIDAKDPYTCGHSDRVARISVRLAQELGCEHKLLHTLYMAGLLHDIGKIGINDAVLRKPSRLTDEEFEHIKEHPELGYRILADLTPLSDVLPAVLHHHEQWDGHGYPCQLSHEQIPLIARIVAVADAYDAMSSDRPYRKGMPAERVDEIFRGGAGVQWDPEVVAAFFRAREDIRQISAHERANLTLNVRQWL
jgi:HD-GYP domain-containing protein (c-di-GMP phosphodiesterase class II)